MKHLLLCATAILSTAASAYAVSPDVIAACSTAGELAGLMMNDRQNGVAISELLERVNSVGATPEHVDELSAMIVEAFQYPDMLSPEGRQRAIQEFRNKFETQCYVMSM